MAKHPLDPDTVEQAQAMAHLGTWMVDPRTGDMTLSDEACRLYDLEPGTEITMADALLQVHPDDREELASTFARLAAGEQIHRWSHRHVTPDGSVRWIEFAGGLDDAGILVGFVQDATYRREVRARMEAARARSELAETVARLGSWMLDATTGTMEWSPQIFRLVDQEPAGSRTIPLDDALALLAPEEVDGARAFLDAVRQGEDVGAHLMRGPSANGDILWLELRARPFGDDRLVGTVQDVTDRRKREDELHLQGRVLETMTEGVALIRPSDARLVWVNDQVAMQVGLTADELVGLPADTFTAPGQEELVAQAGAALRRDGHWRGEIDRIRADGSRYVSQVLITTMDHPVHGTVWLSVTFDVTARRDRERALRDSEIRLRALQDYAPTGIASLSADGRFVYVNDALCELLGRSRAELEQMSITEVSHPDEHDDAVRLGESLRAGVATTAQSERRYFRPDGSIVWALTTASLVRDADGAPDLWVVHLVDITERRTQEEERRRQAVELERANRAKTEFLSRMSHELRTPLNAVLGFAQLLLATDHADEHRTEVGQILTAGRHLLEIIDDVLDISRLESGTLDLRSEPVAVGEVIREVVDAAGRLAADRAVTVTAHPSDDVVRADRRRLAQVVHNLVENAITYNRPDGVVTVRSASGPDGVSIAVADTGRGIPAEDMPRLFEPFDRLGAEQERTEGTGIGLALSRGLVERMGGTIAVASVAGEGSTFTVTLPAAPAGPVDAAATTATTTTPAATEDQAPGPVDDAPLRILSIDDNPANQRLIRAALRRRPEVELWSALDGESGLDLVREHRPGLVLLDLHLPDLPGDEVLRRLRADPPAPAPVIAVCSGDVDPERIESVTRMGADHYLTKPLDLTAFLAVVDEAARHAAGSTIDLTGGSPSEEEPGAVPRPPR